MTDWADSVLASETKPENEVEIDPDSGELPLEPVEETEDKIVFERGDRVELVRDPIVDDWVVVYRTANGVGQPGGIRDREDAIEYALYRLNVIDETDVHPVERIS